VGRKRPRSQLDCCHPLWSGDWRSSKRNHQRFGHGRHWWCEPCARKQWDFLFARGRTRDRLDYLDQAVL